MKTPNGTPRRTSPGNGDVQPGARAVCSRLGACLQVATLLAACAHSGAAEKDTGADPAEVARRGIPAIAIWLPRPYSEMSRRKEAALVIAVWPTGLMLFSEPLLEGRCVYEPRSLRAGTCPPAAIRMCFEKLTQCGFFDLTEISCVGPDAVPVYMFAASQRDFQRVSSWHDLGPGYGIRSMELKRVWSQAKAVILELVPQQSTSFLGSNNDVVRPWQQRLFTMASAIDLGRPIVKAVAAYERDHRAPPVLLEALVPRYLEEKGLRRLSRRWSPWQLIPEVKRVDEESTEWQLQCHFDKGAINRTGIEWIIFRPSNKYPTEFRGNVTHLLGGWAFTPAAGNRDKVPDS